MGEIGRSAEGVFYSFMGLIADTLGFTAKADTKKSQVADYFSSLGGKVGEASSKLEEVAEKAAVDGDKEGILSKAIREAVDVAKSTLSALKGHLEALKDIGDDKVVGDAETSQKHGAADATELEKAFKALKGIVDIAIKEGIPEPKEGEIAVKIVGTVDNKDGAKILSTNSGNNPGNTDAGKAAAILTTVSGKEILASIFKSKESDAALKQAADDKTTAMSFAKGNTGDYLANAKAKAAAVAGGIALRSLVKGGKLAVGAAAQAPGGQEEVQAVGVAAVNKLLVAVEDIIKKTVKNVLDKAKGEIDKARKPKEIVKE